MLIAKLLGEPGPVSGDEGKILGDAVVQVSGHPPPLRERCGLGHPRVDTALGDHRCGEDQSTRQRSQALARADAVPGRPSPDATFEKPAPAISTVAMAISPATRSVSTI